MPINAQYTRYRGEERRKPINFRLDPGYVNPDPNTFLLYITDLDSSGVSIYMRGFSSTKSLVGLPNPLQIDWSLFASGDCLGDDDPIAQGTTWLDVTKTRSGRLFQVTDLDARGWLLKVAVADPGVDFALTGQLEYDYFETPAHSTGASVISGPFIG